MNGKDDTSNKCDEKTAIDRHSNQWVGLTLDEKHYLNDVLNLQGRFPVIEAIESKLKHKNNGQQKWVELTHEEKIYLNEVLNLLGRFPVIEAIESKLKNKNSERQMDDITTNKQTG